MSNIIKVIGKSLTKLTDTTYQTINDQATSARLDLVLDLNRVSDLTISAKTASGSPPVSNAITSYTLTRLKTGEVTVSLTPVKIASTLANYKNGETFYIDVAFDKTITSIEWDFTFGAGTPTAEVTINCILSYTYTDVQFVGYNINAAPKISVGTVKYVGIAGITGADGRTLCADDLEARCQLMQAAIESAAKSTNIDSDSSTLKIFMAPEFYFRGPLGAYEMEDVSSIISLLQTIANKPEYRDWLFVFGSIIGVSYKTKTESGKEVIDSLQAKEVYNICLVQKGNIAGDNGARTIMKEYKSHIDFSQSSELVEGFSDQEVEHLDLMPSTDTGSEVGIKNYTGLSMFRMDNINFALDICLDHYFLRSLLSPDLPNNEEIQIQLIPSLGMSIEANSVIAEKYGYVFNVDGHTNPKSNLREVDGKHSIKPTPVASKSTNVILASPPQVDPAKIFNTTDAGNVILYNTQSMPPNNKVNAIYKRETVNIQGLAIHIFLEYDLTGTFKQAFLRILDTKQFYVSAVINAGTSTTWVNLLGDFKVSSTMSSLTSGKGEISLNLTHNLNVFDGGILKFDKKITVL